MYNPKATSSTGEKALPSLSRYYDLRIGIVFALRSYKLRNINHASVSLRLTKSSINISYNESMYSFSQPYL